MPYQGLIPLHRIPQILDLEVFVIRMRKEDRAGTVEVAFVLALEVGDVGAVVDGCGVETCK